MIVSQYFPVNPGWQTHLNSRIKSLQVPRFLHGVESHSFSSVRQSTPVKPWSQLQTYQVVVLKFRIFGKIWVSVNLGHFWVKKWHFWSKKGISVFFYLFVKFQQNHHCTKSEGQYHHSPFRFHKPNHGCTATIHNNQLPFRSPLLGILSHIHKSKQSVELFRNYPSFYTAYSNKDLLPIHTIYLWTRVHKNTRKRRCLVRCSTGWFS